MQRNQGSYRNDLSARISRFLKFLSNPEDISEYGKAITLARASFAKRRNHFFSWFKSSSDSASVSRRNMGSTVETDKQNSFVQDKLVRRMRMVNAAAER